MPDPAIELVDVNKWFDTFHVLKNINLTVNSGEKVVICGPSGSGKSTVVRCINQLEKHQKGTIRIDGVELKDDARSAATIRSEVGMVFQQFNLFPHLSVLDNLTLGPIKARGLSRAQAEERARHYLERVHICQSALNNDQGDSEKGVFGLICDDSDSPCAVVLHHFDSLCW